MGLHVYNTLILSDLHLGAETSHAREATSLLKEKRFERLILLGDIFADLNFPASRKITGSFWDASGSCPIPSAALRSCGSKGITTTGWQTLCRTWSAFACIRPIAGFIADCSTSRFTDISSTDFRSTVCG